MVRGTYKFRNFEALVKYEPSDVMMAFQFPGAEVIDSDGVIAGILSKVVNENPMFRNRDEVSLIQIPRRTIYVVKTPFAVVIDSTCKADINRSLREVYFTYDRIREEFPRFDAESFEREFKIDYEKIFSNGKGDLVKPDRQRLLDVLDSLDKKVAKATADNRSFDEVARLITKQRELVEQLNRSS